MRTLTRDSTEASGRMSNTRTDVSLPTRRSASDGPGRTALAAALTKEGGKEDAPPAARA